MRRGFLRIYPDGPLVEVTGDMRIGRGAHCEFRIQSNKLSREHSFVTRRDGEFLIGDLNSSFGTWLERRGVQLGRVSAVPRLVRLDDGDIVGMVDKVQFVLDPLPVDPLALQLAEALAADPDDTTRWQVYADRLIEMGDPSGARIIDRATGWEPPGNMVGAFLRSPHVSIDWSHGYFRRVVMVDNGHRDFPKCVQALLGDPLARFLSELAISHTGTAETGLRKVLENVELPALRWLHVTPPMVKPLCLKKSPYLNNP